MTSFGRRLSRGRRQQHRPAAEADREVRALQPRQAVQDRQAVRRHRLQRPITAAAEAAVQPRKPPAQSLPHARQPVGVGGLVAVVGVDHVLGLGGAQRPRLHAVAGERPEVQPLREVGEDDAAPAAVHRPAEERRLRPPHRRRRRRPVRLQQPRRPRPRRQHHGPASVSPLVGLHADDLALLHVQRLDLNALSQLGPVPPRVLRQRRQDLHRVHAAGVRLVGGQLVVGQAGVGVDPRQLLAVDRPHLDAGLALRRQVRLQGGAVSLAHHQHQAAPREDRRGAERFVQVGVEADAVAGHRRSHGDGVVLVQQAGRLAAAAAGPEERLFPAGPRAPPACGPAGRPRLGRSRRPPRPGCRTSETSFIPSYRAADVAVGQIILPKS